MSTLATDSAGNASGPTIYDALVGAIAPCRPAPTEGPGRVRPRARPVTSSDARLETTNANATHIVERSLEMAATARGTQGSETFARG